MIQLGKRCQSTAPLLATSDNPSELLKSARSNFRPRKITRSTQLAQPYSTARLEPAEQTTQTSAIPSDSDIVIRSATGKAGHESRLTSALEMPTIAKSSQRGNGDFQTICWVENRHRPGNRNEISLTGCFGDRFDRLAFRDYHLGRFNAWLLGIQN